MENQVCIICGSEHICNYETIEKEDTIQYNYFCESCEASFSIIKSKE